MTIPELLTDVQNMKNYRKLPKYINDASPSERECLTTVILKKEDGLMLIKQYSKKYIRFAAGEIAEMLYQVPVTPDEATKVRLGEYSMADVVNSYSNQGKLKPDVLIDNLIRDYLEQNTKYSDKRKNKIIEGLRKHGDIFYEFYYYVLTGKFEEKGVTVEGFDAKTLHEKYPLSVLGAYNYLIYLREDPENALRDLKNGLPRK